MSPLAKKSDKTPKNSELDSLKISLKRVKEEISSLEGQKRSLEEKIFILNTAPYKSGDIVYASIKNKKVEGKLQYSSRELTNCFHFYPRKVDGTFSETKHNILYNGTKDIIGYSENKE